MVVKLDWMRPVRFVVNWSLMCLPFFVLVLMYQHFGWGINAHISDVKSGLVWIWE